MYSRGGQARQGQSDWPSLAGKHAACIRADPRPVAGFVWPVFGHSLPVGSRPLGKGK